MEMTKLQIQPGWKLAQAGIEGSGMGNEAGIVYELELAKSPVHKGIKNEQKDNEIHLAMAG